MALRNNHYDAAFEAFLTQTCVPFVVVDEARRAVLQQASLKSMDFIVYSRRQWNLIVDVKGRRFPSGSDDHVHKWENWATADDIESLLRWQTVFGAGFRSLLVFAYCAGDARALCELGTCFQFRERHYAFFGVWADEYRDEMRQRSPSWQTVSLPSRVYREKRSTISEFL